MKCDADRRIALRTLAPGLPQTYRCMFQRIEPADRIIARRALIWLIYGEYRLPLEDLAVAAVINPEDPCFDPERRLDTPELLIEILGSFAKLNIALQRIEISHCSVTEYLTSRTLDGESTLNPDYIDRVESHGEIFVSCLKYLNFISDDGSHVQSGSYPKDILLGYAMDCWPLHARYVECIPKYRTLIISFLRDQTSLAHQRWQRIFLEHTDVELPPVDMQTPLYYASLFGFLHVVVDLLRLDVNENPVAIGYALLGAIEWGQPQTATKLLEEKHLNVDFCTSQGETALLWCSELGNVYLAQHLLRRGASVAIVPGCRWSALHVAAMSGTVDIANLLLTYGAEVTLRAGVRQFTPLHLAAWYGNSSLVGLFKKCMEQQVQGNRGQDLSNVSDSSMDQDNIWHTWEEGITVDRLELYRVLLDHFPDDHILYEFAGDTYFQRGLYQTAYALYHAGLSANPKNLSVLSLEDIAHCDFCYNCGDNSPDDEDILMGYRYRCMVCPDFDLCSNCFNFKPFPHDPHEFKSIPSAEWVAKRFSRN